MKRIILFTFMLGLLGIGCGGNRTENSDAMDRDTMGDQNYRNGSSMTDTTMRDTVDSVLPPTPAPVTPN